MSFGFDLSIGIFVGGRGSGAIRTDLPEGEPTKKTRDNLTSNAQLPLRIQTAQRNVLEQRERERLVDHESLHLLEAATAASSNRAKYLDQQSLAVLMDLTKPLEMGQIRSNVPSEDWIYPAVLRLKRPGSSPPSYSQSISTPWTYMSEWASPESTKEFLQLPSGDEAASKTANAVAKKIPWDMLNGQLAAAGWLPSSTEEIATTESDHRRSRIEAVHGWFDKLEDRDAEDGWEKLEGHLRGSDRTPLLSSKPESARSFEASHISSRKGASSQERSADKNGVSLPSSTAKATNSENNQDLSERFREGRRMDKCWRDG